MGFRSEGKIGRSGVVLKGKRARMAFCKEWEGGSQTSLMFPVIQGKRWQLYREIACLKVVGRIYLRRVGFFLSLGTKVMSPNRRRDITRG